MNKLDPFLENWKRVLATAPAALKFVRILEGVATIVAPGLVLRCPTGLDTPDGFYKMVGTENRLIPVVDFKIPGFWNKSEYVGYYDSNPMRFFPDVVQFNPGFEQLKPFCALDKQLVKNILALCEHVRRVEGTLLMTDSCLTMRQRPHEDLTLAFNFSIPNGDAYLINPEELKLALIEMLRYDRIFLTRKDTEEPSPLVLGLNWTQCALVRTSVIPRPAKGIA